MLRFYKKNIKKKKILNLCSLPRTNLKNINFEAKDNLFSQLNFFYLNIFGKF